MFDVYVIDVIQNGSEDCGLFSSLHLRFNVRSRILLLFCTLERVLPNWAIGPFAIRSKIQPRDTQTIE